MRLRYPLSLLLCLLAFSAHADALADLRGTLSRLPGSAPTHGAIDIASTIRSDEDAKPEEGKTTIGFDVSDAGLRVIYPKAVIDQAEQEARSEALDAERATPVRTAVGRVRALHVNELLDAATALSTSLQTAQLMGIKPAPYHGKAARLVSIKLNPKFSKSDSKRLKKVDATLSVWIGDDGVPLGAERSIYVKLSMLMMSFEQTQKESWTYARVGDRLVATRYESTAKSDGMGQHSQTQTTEVVRLD